MNYDPQTVDGFGEEWTRYDHASVQPTELERSFALYFSLFPWGDLSDGAIGYDLGCGSGRWATLVAKRVGKLYCIDASEAALSVARMNLATMPNVEFCHASVEAIPLAANSMDFGYSLGVLHHVPDTSAGLKVCVEKLKVGAPFLLYLYYAFDNQPLWYRCLWRLSDVGRTVISKLPFGLRHFSCQIIAALIYWPLARLAQVIERLGGKVSSFPLSWYRDLSFYAMCNDALDRFGTRLEQRFTQQQICQMMQAAGLERIAFSTQQPYWCAIGFKKAGLKTSHDAQLTR